MSLCIQVYAHIHTAKYKIQIEEFSHSVCLLILHFCHVL